MKIEFKSILITLVMSSSIVGNTVLWAKGLDEVPKLIADNKTKEAIVIIRNRLQAEPSDYKAHAQLAEIYFKTNEYLKAEKELLQVKALKANPEIWLIPLARLYEMNNDTKKILELVNGLDPNLIKNESDWGQDVNVIRAKALLSNNELGQSKEQLEKVLKSNSKHVEALWTLSKIQLLSNDITTGKATLQKAFDFSKTHSNPGLDSKLLTTQAEIDRFDKKIDEATLNYQKAIELDQNNLLALLGLSSLYLEQNNKKEFINSATQLYKLAPNYPKAVFFMGLVELESKNKEKGINLLERANQLDGSDVGNQFILAKIYYDDKQFERADTLLTSVVKRQPRYFPGVSLLAALKMKLNQPQEAAKLLEPFVNDKTNNYRILGLLGSAKIMSGEIEAGTALLQRAAKIDPTNSSIKADLALGYIASGQSDLAQETLDEVVQADPNLLQADVLLIYTALSNQNYEKAKVASEQLLKKAGNNPVPYNLLGLSYVGLKDFASAKTSFEKSISKNEGFINARNNLAEVYRLEKNYKEAKNILLKAIALDQNNLPSLMMLSKIAEESGEKAEALEWINKAEDRNPNQIEPAVEKVKYYFRNKESKAGLEYAKLLPSKFPNDLTIQNLLAHLYLMNGEYADALKMFTSLTKQFPQSAPYWQGTARAELGLQKLENAKHSIDKAIQLEPKNVANQLIKAEVSMRLKDYGIALTIGETLLKENQAPSLAHRLIGDALLARGEPQEAAKAYRKSLDLEKSEDVIRALYRSKQQAGDLKEGFNLIENEIKTNPSNTSLRRFIATEYLINGDAENARLHYEIILKTEPNDLPSLNNLASIYLKIDTARAVALAQKAYALNPNHAKVTDTLGFALIKNGQAPQGISLIRQALKLDNSSEIRYHLAIGLDVIGDKNSAKMELKKALESKGAFESRQEAQKLLENLTHSEG
ncbi:MAG: XrtA/PEP-CTERM system TPR-repeat protein PrsT [Gammaproteobacteria bacterium]